MFTMVKAAELYPIREPQKVSIVGIWNWTRDVYFTFSLPHWVKYTPLAKPNICLISGCRLTEAKQKYVSSE